MKPDGPPLLQIEDLAVSYQGRLYLQNVSLAVWPEQVVALVGPNGAGKTTILKAVGGLLPVAAGRIRFADQDITGLPVWEIVSRGIVYVPEGMKVFPHMSVQENLEVGAYLDRQSLAARLALVYDLFPQLAERRSTLAGDLSGGQQRLVTLGRALMSKARLLLLDDPFLGLSPRFTSLFCDAFRTLRRAGRTLVLAGQHVRRILNVADQAFLVENGRLTLSGAGTEILADPHFRETLFGANRHYNNIACEEED